jgi:hypothetical protein
MTGNLPALAEMAIVAMRANEVLSVNLHHRLLHANVPAAATLS